MFVSPICTGTVLVGKEVPVTAATATMRIKKKATDKSDSESLCDKAAATTGQTHPKPISAQLNDSNRSWDSGACKTKKRQKKEKGNSVQERQRKMDNCPVWGQTAAAAAALQQPSSFLPRNLTNTLSPSALIIFVLHPNVHPLSLVFLRQTMVVVFMCHFYFVTLRSFLSQFCQIVLLFFSRTVCCFLFIHY